MVTTPQQSGKLKPRSSLGRRVRAAVLSAAILFALFAVLQRSYAGLKAQAASRLQRLQSMLMDIRSLRPGVSSFDEALKIAHENKGRPLLAFGPCTSDQCTLEMNASSAESALAVLLGGRLLGQLGMHAWQARGWIAIEKHIVTSYGAQIAVQDPEHTDLWHEATWTLFQEIPQVDEAQEEQFLRNFDPTHDRSRDFLVNWTNSRYADRVELLDARVSVRATDSQRHAAEDFNLKCLIAKGDCSSACDLLPGAARYYNESLGVDQSTLPHPNCN